MKKCFITGIAGQDGSFLAEYLLSLGYEVHGIIRRNSIAEHQESRIHHLDDKITTYYGDVLDQASLTDLLSDIKPHEIYNLAAQSHVRISFDIPQATIMSNGIGVQNVLEAYRKTCPDALFYQASSSEIFGNSVDRDNFQYLHTPMMPVSPYGAAKLFGFHITRVYRAMYNLKAFNGILFNHESSRRATNFVTSKIIQGACKIKLGWENKLELGNLDAKRDWGHSKDYVRAMHLIINQKENIEYDVIVATGETRSVRELCNYVFNKLGMDYNDHVILNTKFLRPNELKYLKGDNTFINQLGWKPKYTFESMIDEMLEYHMNALCKKMSV